uniref:Uncharacterized protein n=1 Tax=Lactuca sativa TaxID=4236 RepID=A0A9R1WF14_LACSA|nr:hypothetical protein LSAT_V11C100046450 [Lactuca sativa]
MTLRTQIMAPLFLINFTLMMQYMLKNGNKIILQALSKVFNICLEESETNRWESSLEFLVEALPFNYLGVPIGTNITLKKHRKPIIGCFQFKLSIWKAKSLFFGMLVTLLKTIFGSLATYYFSIVKTPSCIIDDHEKI